MKVTKVLTFLEYDNFCRTLLVGKIPDWKSADFKRKVGDCIYDFSPRSEPLLRRSVHKEANRQTDLSGKNVLLSEHFYYFGDRPVELPQTLQPIVHATQGHKSRANAQYVEKFVAWIEGKGWHQNMVLGEPPMKGEIMSMPEEDCRSTCSLQDQIEGELDEIC